MTSVRDYGSLKYRKLKQPQNCDDEFVDLQFDEKPAKVPWKAIIFSVVLFVLGSGLLITAILILIGFTSEEKYDDRPISLAILGILMFLPGVYHTRIAYYAMTGHPSYSFNDIPEFQ